MQMVNTTASSEDHTYKLVTGKASQVRDHYNALRVDLREPSCTGRKLTIEARAYDDAVAFRYFVPEQNAMSDFRLIKEGTEFRIAKDATAYALVLPNFRSGYESEYIKLHFAAIVPFWAVWPFKTIVIPRRHAACLPELSAQERDSLAYILKRLTARTMPPSKPRSPIQWASTQRPTDGEAHTEWHMLAHFSASASLRDRTQMHGWL